MKKLVKIKFMLFLPSNHDNIKPNRQVDKEDNSPCPLYKKGIMK